uniref:Uncharacterized protein n=1 Tax=Tanacetum cinerariifolium TaxID=118510 RepID=A0A699J789_TANCI|nr:hypothetical protein [Tanacetum cinerariifolium]
MIGVTRLKMDKQILHSWLILLQALQVLQTQTLRELHAPKPDLVFADEHVASESVTSLPDVAKSKVKTSETKLKNVSAPIIEDWVSDSEDEDEIETEKFVKQEESNGQTKYPRKTSQSPRVVSAIQGNRENVFKSSACWIWRPTGNVIDHISKDSGSYMLKRFNYIDLQGNKSFLTDYQDIDGGFVAFGGSPKGEIGFVMNLEFKLVVGKRLVLNRCLDWIATAAKNEIQD